MTVANVTSVWQVPKNIPQLTTNLCIQLLSTRPELKTLKKLHSKIILNKLLNSDPSITIKLMTSYSACTETTSARHLFDKTPHKNIVFHNVMIRTYVNNQMYPHAIQLFRTTSSQVRPDNYTYPCILKACSGSKNMHFGVQIHGAVVKVGLDLNLYVGNGLVAMYGKCGWLRDARKVLDEMVGKDVVSWNSMVSGYAYNGRFDDALGVCREMGVVDAGTMASLLPAVSDTSVENVLYVREMFMGLRECKCKSLVPWNVMIAVYVKNSMVGEAVDIFKEMRAEGLEPDAVTVASVLPACGNLSAILLGREIHEYARRKKLLPNLLLENALIDMYAKCGCLKDARDAFDGMRFRDVVSWTSMISAYGMNGQGRNAVDMFSRMLESGLNPDAIAFVSVLSACSHGGLVNEGRYYFKMMTDECGIVPRLEHFACMVDLLGRAGKVEEAYDFIKRMPIEPNEKVWGALLSASRVYSNMEIGLIAADSLFKLTPEQSGYYVLLSNIYAKAGKWEAVTTVRSVMKSRGIKKLPGISNVELKDGVHTFLAGDRYHPQSKAIYEELDILVGKMKELGYVPETDSALHDVEEEDKECHLAVHSEKLAIVFALLNTEPGTPIRITKNLRVCGDCHIAARLISKITEREIIIRDANRFHHFHDGECSCENYW